MVKTTLLKTIIILAISVIAGNYVNAQNATATKSSRLDSTRAQNFYVELGGPGIIFSANYDTRFSNTQDGLGGRVGIGGLSSGSSSIFTMPLQLNYLLGKDDKFFEIGVGVTINSGNIGGIFNSSTIGTMVFGYRLQPKNSGFSFRAFVSPVFDGSNFTPYFVGLSFGYSFHN